MSESEYSAQEELATLTADLRGILEWERSSGATYLEAEPRQIPQAVPRHTVAAGSPHQEPPRPNRSPPMNRPSLKPVRQSVQAPAEPGLGAKELQAAESSYGQCARCGVSIARHNVIYGAGPSNVDLVVIGDVPSRNEEVIGEAFVGRAGKLLNRMLEAIGLKRDSVYLCNVVGCGPSQKQGSDSSGVNARTPVLHQQLQTLEPKVILTVGRFAPENIADSQERMTELRGTPSSMNGIPVVTTYHPAYLLRNPGLKRQAWEDLQKVQALLKS